MRPLRRARPVGRWRSLPGPTGERNVYALAPRQAVLCLADDDGDRLIQLAAVLAVGSRALWPSRRGPAWQRLPEEARDRIVLVDDWTAPAGRLRRRAAPRQPRRAAAGAAQARARGRGRSSASTALAAGDTAIPLERLVVERSLSVNTAAAGGNASLMTIG